MVRPFTSSLTSQNAAGVDDGEAVVEIAATIGCTVGPAITPAWEIPDLPFTLQDGDTVAIFIGLVA